MEKQEKVAGVSVLSGQLYFPSLSQSARNKVKEIVPWLIKGKERGMCRLSDLPGLCRRLMSDGSRVQYF